MGLGEAFDMIPVDKPVGAISSAPVPTSSQMRMQVPGSTNDVDVKAGAWQRGGVLPYTRGVEWTAQLDINGWILVRTYTQRTRTAYTTKQP